MRKAIVELRGCSSYCKGARLFVKDIPQVVEGDQSIAFFKSREEFSVREIAPVVDPIPEPMVEEVVEPELDDSDLPPPVEQGELAEPEPAPIVEKSAKRKIVKKAK